MAIISTGVRAVVARGLCVALLVGGLGACDVGGVSQNAGPAAPPPADYLTKTEQFAALTPAAVSADYPAFARPIGADDPAPVVAALTRNFQGQPFDAYTRRAVDDANAHKRLVELRTTRGRLYLFLAMERVETGWNLADYELTRNRGAAQARLGAPTAPSG